MARVLQHLPCCSFQTLQWRHNERECVSIHWRLDCLLKRFFRRRIKETSKLCVTGLCEGNLTVTGEFPTQRGPGTRKCFHLMTSWRKPSLATRQSHWNLLIYLTVHPMKYARSLRCLMLCYGSVLLQFTLIQCSTVITHSIFFQNSHKRHTIARPLGRGMVCLL